MEMGTLFLKSNSTGIITFSELDWITTHQSNFTRLEESIAIKLGRMLDAGSINIGLPFEILISFYFNNEYQKEKKIFFRERIHSLNIFLFLGFNLSLISILGFIWFNSAIEKVV